MYLQCSHRHGNNVVGVGVGSEKTGVFVLCGTPIVGECPGHYVQAGLHDIQ